jgi:acetate kinase
MGVAIDSAKNEARESTISATGSSVQVSIVASQEDRQIARHCRALMRKG